MHVEKDPKPQTYQHSVLIGKMEGSRPRPYETGIIDVRT